MHDVGRHGGARVVRPWSFLLAHGRRWRPGTGGRWGDHPTALPASRPEASSGDAGGHRARHGGGAPLRPWTFRVIQRGVEVAVIRKQWNGLLQEPSPTRTPSAWNSAPECTDARLRQMMLGRGAAGGHDVVRQPQPQVHRRRARTPGHHRLLEVTARGQRLRLDFRSFGARERARRSTPRTPGTAWRGRRRVSWREVDAASASGHGPGWIEPGARHPRS